MTQPWCPEEAHPQGASLPLGTGVEPTALVDRTFSKEDLEYSGSGICSRVRRRVKKPLCTHDRKTVLEARGCLQMASVLSGAPLDFTNTPCSLFFLLMHIQVSDHFKKNFF